MTTADAAVRRFAAADPARGLAPDIAAAEATLHAILATPPAAPRRRRRRLRGGLALGFVALASATAGALDGGLPDPPPPGIEGVGANTPAQAREEAIAAERVVPLAPGEPDPGVGPLPGGIYSDGVGASTVVLRRQCTWQRQLLLAHAAGDTDRIARIRAVLERPFWYRYFEAESAAYQRRVNLSGDVGLLRQAYVANCDGVTRPLP